MLRAALLLAASGLSMPIPAIVIESSDWHAWEWWYQHREFAATNPTAKNHLDYCEAERIKANQVINWLEDGEKLAGDTGIDRDVIAAARGNAEMRSDHFSRCAWEQKQRLP